MQSAARSLIAVVLAIGLVTVFLRNADLTQVRASMRDAHPGWIAAVVLLTLTTYVIRTERWQYLLEPLGRTRFAVAFRATVIGFAASSVLPARAGEVIRPYLLARQEGLSTAATIATIVVERILDLVAVLMLLATYLLFFDPGMAARDSALFGAIRLGGLVMAPVAVAALVVMYLLAGHAVWLDTLVGWCRRLLPARAGVRAGDLLRTFAAGFGVLRRPERLLASLGWSLVMWVVICAETWVVARAFDIAMPFAGSWLMLALLIVGIAVPTPGGVGGFHEAFRLGATAFFGAENNAAVGAAIVLHAASFVPVTIMGLWFAARDGLGVKGLKQMATPAAPAEVEA